MQKDDHQIGLRSVVVVESKIEIEVGAEVCVDVIIRRKQVNARKLICERDVIPGGCKRRIGKVTDYADRACASEHARAERRELRPNANGNIAVEPRAPDIRRMLEGNQALLAERRPGIAADGSSRCRIIESHARSIYVHDDDLGRTGKSVSASKADEHQAKHQ